MMNAILSLMDSEGARGSGLVVSREADRRESMLSVEPKVGAGPDEEGVREEGGGSGSEGGRRSG